MIYSGRKAMKSNIINDERIQSQKRKIQSDALQIVSFFLLISVAVQQFLLNAPLAQFAVELISLISIATYVLIKNMKLGLNVMSSNIKSTKEIIFNGIFTGIMSTLFIIILAGERNPLNLALFFLTFDAVFSLTNITWRSLVIRKELEIEKKLNEDE